jgi:hypothetical protein
MIDINTYTSTNEMRTTVFGDDCKLCSIYGNFCSSEDDNLTLAGRINLKNEYDLMRTQFSEIINILR